WFTHPATVSTMASWTTCFLLTVLMDSGITARIISAVAWLECQATIRLALSQSLRRDTRRENLMVSQTRACSTHGPKRTSDMDKMWSTVDWNRSSLLHDW